MTPQRRKPALDLPPLRPARRGRSWPLGQSPAALLIAAAIGAALALAGSELVSTAGDGVQLRKAGQVWATP